MAATFRSYGNQTTDGGTSVTTSKPLGTVNGDIMIAVCYGHSSGTHSWSDPGSWTVISSADYLDSFLKVFYKRAGSSEPSNYEFTFGSTGNLSVSILTYLSDIDDTVFDDSNIDTGTLDAPSVTTQTDDLTVLRILFGDNSNSVTITPDAATTERAPSSTLYIIGSISEEVQASAGATGASTFVVTNGTLLDEVSMTIALLDGVWSGAGSGGAAFYMFLD